MSTSLAPSGKSARPPEKLSLDEALRSARETRALVVGAGALARVADMFREQFPGSRAVVVCDPNTQRVAGDQVLAHLRKAGVCDLAPVLLTAPDLYAEFRFVEQVQQALRGIDAVPVAVGSGTINDLVKLAAHRLGRQYLCVATAASMDGYTAFGASITYQGAKQTFNCPAPRAVVADIDIISRAPAEMTASGYADLMAKVTAGADWIVADALEVEKIEPRAWDIVQGRLRDALADPAGARAGRATAISPLVEGLMLGGFAMQWTKSSRPASGAEHQFSHLWDMEHHTHNGAAPSHGFKVGIATLAVTAFYEALLAQPIDRLDVERACAAWPSEADARAAAEREFAQSDFTATAVTETAAKHVSREQLRAQLHLLRGEWSGLRARLQQQLLPYAELKQRLAAVGAPTEPEQIGISRERLRRSFVRAQFIRRRFTVLDLALRAGITESCLATLFGAGRPWAVS